MQQNNFFHRNGTAIGVQPTNNHDHYLAYQEEKNYRLSCRRCEYFWIKTVPSVLLLKHSFITNTKLSIDIQWIYSWHENYYTTVDGSHIFSIEPIFKTGYLLGVCHGLLVPYRLAVGILSLLAVCLSVCQSDRHTSVFRTFLCRLLRYWLEIWFMNLSWHNTDQVWVWSRLTYFYRSCCPLLKPRRGDYKRKQVNFLSLLDWLRQGTRRRSHLFL